MLTEKDLILKCIKEDALAQKQLFKEYKNKLYSACLRYISNKEDAKDVLQDSFVKIFKNISTFKATSSLETWMRRIVANTSIDFLRKKKKINFFELDTNTINTLENREDADFEINSLFSKEQLYSSINLLPEELKIVLNLYYLDDFSHKEIAESLSIKEETSRTRLFRAKAMVKNNMTKLNQIKLTH